MVNKDFFAALDELEKEKRIDKAVFIESLEAGLASAYKRQVGEARNVLVVLNEAKFSINIYAYKTVVETVEDPEKEISLEDAKAIKSTYKVGDIVSEDITPKDFSRIAAQTAKQVITQRLNDHVKNMVLEEMNEKEGEILTAIVRRVENDTVYVEMTGSQLEGVMMPSDQIRGEKYNVGDVINVYVKTTRTTTKGATQVLVSRSNIGFVKRLFEHEVPEIKAGLVSIKHIVREAGYRTKMAVFSEDPSIDAVGSCIGNKGMRINSIVQQLGGEKIDVIGWCQDPLEYISRALSPAKVIMVQVNENEKSAKVIVPDDKLSLAIGKAGQNVRLAAKLTGWKIDVKPYSTVADKFNEGLIEE
ncbi:MAG: transcription termination factor NusA [Eubacteriales bacterium]|nr:transcription termination factor NusA [Eubacteriales bacterium]